jgi:RNA polymerase sigma factor (sigma-70 family)
MPNAYWAYGRQPFPYWIMEGMPVIRARQTGRPKKMKGNVYDCYLQREEAKLLSAAMDKLMPGLRKAIELRDLGELSTQETARRMGLSVMAVKARVFHGRRKLREALRAM